MSKADSRKRFDDDLATFRNNSDSWSQAKRVRVGLSLYIRSMRNAWHTLNSPPPEGMELPKDWFFLTWAQDEDTWSVPVSSVPGYVLLLQRIFSSVELDAQTGEREVFGWIEFKSGPVAVALVKVGDATLGQLPLELAAELGTDTAQLRSSGQNLAVPVVIIGDTPEDAVVYVDVPERFKLMS